MTMVLYKPDGTVVKIVSSKKLAQMIVCCFVANTLALAER